MDRKKSLFIATIIILAFIDIFSKYWVFDSFSVVIVPPGETALGMQEIIPGVFVPFDYKRVEIIPSFFYISIVVNRGAIWGVMQGKTTMITIVAIGAILTIFYLIFVAKEEIKPIFPLGLIIAGALGNLWDRFFFSGVRDFLDIHLGSYQWPTFNMADVFIIVGVTSYFYFQWFLEDTS